MSSRLTVTRPAWFAAATASRDICSAISVKTSFNALTADKETRSAPAFLAILSKGAEGKDPAIIFTSGLMLRNMIYIYWLIFARLTGISHPRQLQQNYPLVLVGSRVFESQNLLLKILIKNPRWSKLLFFPIWLPLKDSPTILQLPLALVPNIRLRMNR
mgnify:CR=1 FL=1